MNISDERFLEIYGECNKSKERFLALEKHFTDNFGLDSYEFFSSPGRTEIVGNHTDHNGGRVIAGSISMDTIAAAAKNNTRTIEIISEGYDGKIIVDLDNDSFKPEKTDTTALLYGMVKAIKDKGYNIDGFSAYVSTNVIAAAGVSSSASFEMLICTIVNYFFNDNKIDFIEYAKIGQYAENNYWNKASGLMDQLACAVGGAIKLDFSGEVSYEKVPFDFDGFDYKFILVNSAESHADLSEEYSAVPKEMNMVARAMGYEKLGETTLENLMANYENVSRSCGNDRAILRSFHFFEENRRVDELSKAMSNNDTPEILRIIEASGNSSWKYLQNCYVPGISKKEGVAVNLSLSELINQKINGVCRIHGGGFCGVILEVVPSEHADEYIEYMLPKVGAKNIYSMKIRNTGAVHI